MEYICTVCDGLGQERRKITNPLANVAGWHRESSDYRNSWYRRRCERCGGSGYIRGVVPVVPAPGLISPTDENQ